MHIAILLAGHTNPAMPKHFLDYHELLANLFKSLPVGRDFQFSTWPVVDGVFPDQINKYDGYLISGSSFGIYDNAPFISKLMHLIRQIYDAKKPLVGICFGHQIIAHALGGNAQKWAAGWGLGVKELTLIKPPDWIGTKNKTFYLIHVHQDQVTRLPDRGQLIATTNHCKYAAYIIEDLVFSIQGHPEFDLSYTNALIELLKNRTSPRCIEEARESFSTPHEGKKTARWILSFFASHAPTW